MPLRTFLILSLCILALSSYIGAIEAESIIDGDTFRLTSGEKVRLIGVDCPESRDPNKPVEYFADQSKEFLRRLISGKKLRLEYGNERTDKYGRLLCYVWVNDTTLVNHEIIANGYGMSYLRFSHDKEMEFLEAELMARRQAVGMWASPRSGEPLLEVQDDCDTTSSCYQLGLAKGKLEAIELAKQLMQSAPAQTQSSPSIAPTKSTDTEIVYITKSGSKYHRGNCGYLRKSKIPISKSDAKSRGYGPCSKCRP